MHSHDRTLLAKLGFADRDKQDPRHDWACQYLVQTDALVRMLVTMLSYKGKITISGKEMEHHITKGQGQYKTTIGFHSKYSRTH